MMKKMILGALTLLSAAGLFAQSVPQPAFRLLDGYIEKRNQAAEYGAKNGSWILMGTGAVLGAASATVWFGSDSIARSAGVSPMTNEAKFATTLGLGIGAVVLGGIGVILHTFPPVFDERVEYSAIYHETDPVLQESMAAARLKSLSEDGRSSRIVAGWMNLGLAGAGLTFKIVNNNQHDRVWSDGLFNQWNWEAGSILGGTVSLLVPSPQERLYQEYLDVSGKETKD